MHLIDTVIRNGRGPAYYAPPELPMVLGREVAGNPERKRDLEATALAQAAAGRLVPLLSRFPLADAARREQQALDADAHEAGGAP